MFKAALVASALLLTSFTASAYEVVRFNKGANGAWQVGDKSQMYHTDDGKVGIQMIVKKSTITGKSYYVVGFQTKNGTPVKFSARVTDKEPTKAHFTGRAEPGKVFTWGEHLPANLNAVYVLYDASRS